MKIRAKNTLLFLSLSLIPLMGVGKFAYENGRQAIKKNLGLAFQQLAHTQIENVENNIGEVYKSVGRWSKMSIMQEVVIGDMDATIQSFLLDVKKENKNFTYISVMNSEGAVIASTLPEMLGKNFGAARADNPRVEDVHYSDISGEWELTFVFPIKAQFAQDQIIGSLMAGWSASALSRMVHLSTEGSTESGTRGNHFMLMRNDGLVIAAPAFEQNNIFKVNLIKEGLRSALLASQKHEGYLIEENEHGVESLIGYGYTNGHTDFPDLGWFGFVFSNTDMALAAVERLKVVTFAGGLIVALVVILLSIIASNQMAMPLLDIAQAADELARGNFQTRVAMNSKDEFADLARAFNAMAEDLQKTTISKTYFESIIATANDAFVSTDQQGIIRDWNQAAERAFGWTRAQALGKTLEETIIPPQYRQAHLKGLKHFMETGEGPVIGKTLELAALHRDGHEFPIEIAVWVTDRTDEKYQFNAFIRDITQRKAMERKFETILETAPDAIIIVDSEEKIVIINSQVEKMFGYNREELLGKSIEIFLPQELKLRHIEHRKKFANDSKLRPMGPGLDLFGVTKDGRQVPLEISLAPMKAGGENLVIATVRDVTQRKTKENELRHAHQELAEREKALRRTFGELINAHEQLKSTQNQLVQSEKLASIGQLAAGVAHEINNPVGFISNNMEILEQYLADYAKILTMGGRVKESLAQGDLAGAKAAAEEMARMEKETNLDYIIRDTPELLQHNRKGIERIQKIVNDLRAFSREDKNVMERVQIEDVIEGILTIVHSEVKYKAKLEKNYGDTPPIECSPQRLGQVFINLIVNALQAIEGSGTIEIKTYRQNDLVCVDVRDTGKGIPQENLDKIFDPFFTTKPVGHGTGLGLSVSQEIVKKHGGEITVRSQPDKGTTFTIKLPVDHEKGTNS